MPNGKIKNIVQLFEFLSNCSVKACGKTLLNFLSPHEHDGIE